MSKAPVSVIDPVDSRTSSPTSMTANTSETVDAASPGGVANQRSRVDRSTHPSTGRFGDDRVPLLPSVGSRSRLPQLVLAALCIVGGSLGALLLFSQYDERSPVVVVATEVAAGTELTRDHLALSTAALDDELLVVDSIDQVVGRFATHDLAPGDILSTTDLGDVGRRVTAEQSVVGLLLSPGAYPTGSMGPGDRVDAFATADESSADLIAEDLLVLDVVESSNDGRTLLVSVVAPNQADAQALIAGDSESGLRLTLRGEG